MISDVRGAEKYSCIIFSSETVVFDSRGNTVVKCPTEMEAVEYIRDLASEVDKDAV
jgi:hypothetical protein